MRSECTRELTDSQGSSGCHGCDSMAQNQGFEVVRDVLVTFWWRLFSAPLINFYSVPRTSVGRKGKRHTKMVQLLPMAGYQTARANHFRRRLSEPTLRRIYAGDWRKERETVPLPQSGAAESRFWKKESAATTGKGLCGCSLGLFLFFYYYPYFSY